MTIPTTSRRLLTLGAAGATALVLAGCGSGGSTPTATASAGSGASAANSGQGGNGGFGQNRVPGTFGLIAAIQGTTLQVQSTTDQTAVVYTAKTTITDQVAAKATDVKVGDCISARSAAATGTAGSSPSAAAGAPTSVAATTVTILSSTGTGCTDLTAGGGFGGGGGGFGGPPAGTGGSAPGGAPSGRPSGAPTGGFRGGFGGFGATGEVTAVSAGSFTVTESFRAVDRNGSSGAPASPTASPSTTSRTVTVTYTSTTTFDRTAKAAPSAITVGSCVRALGQADDTGTVTATSLALSKAVNGQCTSAVRGG